MKKKLIISTTDSVTLATILKGVPKYLNQFFEVKLVGSPGPDVDRIVAAEGVPLEGIRMTRQVTPLADLEALRQLYAYFKRERPDIVHSYTPKAGLLCMMAAAAVGVPHRVHSILGLPMMETQGAMRAIFSVTERVTYLCATHLISIGPGLRDYIHQHLTRKPLHLIGDGGMKNVDMDWFRDEFDTGAKQRIRADLKLAPTDFVVAYVGRIVRDKGIVELVDAVVEVYDRHPSVRLLLVGIHDEARDVLPAQTRRLIDSHPAIRMRGWTWDIRPSFAAADVYALPSYREGLNTSLMEAAAFGLPCIASDIIGCREIVSDGVNGLLVAPKNSQALAMAITTLIEDEGKYRAMRARARPSVEKKYCQRRYLEGLKNEYFKLLGEISVPSLSDQGSARPS